MEKKIIKEFRDVQNSKTKRRAVLISNIDLKKFLKQSLMSTRMIFVFKKDLRYYQKARVGQLK